MEYRLDYVAILMGDVDVHGFRDAWPENKGESLWKFLPVSFFSPDHFSRITCKCYNLFLITYKKKKLIS